MICDLCPESCAKLKIFWKCCFAFGTVWLFVHIFAVMEKKLRNENEDVFFYKKMRDAKITSCHAIYWNGDWLTPKCRSETVCVMLWFTCLYWKWVRSYYYTQTLMVMKIFICLSGRMPPFAQLFCNWQSERINYNLSFEKKRCE